jgi:hypothetical protein
MKRSIIALLAVVGLFALACGFLDPDDAREAMTVTYHEDFDVGPLLIDANEACPPDADCNEDSAPSPTDVELMPIEFNIDIDIVDAMGNDDLRNISSRLRSLEITSIDYDVADNDLTFDLPDMEIYVAPIGTEDSDDEDAIHLTTIPSTAAGENASGNAPVIEANRDASSELFKTLEFTALPKAQPMVREGQPFPPSGSAEVTLTINLRLTANPTD